MTRAVALRRRLVVRGRVQGVFFRQTCKEEADRARVRGWARNLEDGSVEVVIQGDALDVEALTRWCHDGPPRALVTSVTATDEPLDETLVRFSVR